MHIYIYTHGITVIYRQQLYDVYLNYPADIPISYIPILSYILYSYIPISYILYSYIPMSYISCILNYITIFLDPADLRLRGRAGAPAA